MDDRMDQLLETPVVVMLLVLMCSICTLWAVSCSWISGRKKRQRVADNADVGDMAMQLPRTVSSTKIRPIDKYTVMEPSKSFTDNPGSHLSLWLLPVIVITPPSPTNLFVEVASVNSDSSIGSADDLMQSGVTDTAEDDGNGVTDSEIFSFGKRAVIRDSMRNKLSCFSSSPSIDSDGAATVFEFPSIEDGASHLVVAADVAPVSETKSSVVDVDVDPSDGAALPRVPTLLVGEKTPSTCVALPVDGVTTLPGISSVDPGTYNVELEMYQWHHL